MGKHRDKMAQDLALRGMSANTCENYLRYARRFVKHHGRSVERLGTEDARRWLLFLLQEKRLAPATVNVAIASLRFLFLSLGRPEVMQSIPYVRNRHHTPDVLSGSEIQRLLVARGTDIKHRAMFALLYGAGLRVSELLALKVSDIDRQRMVVHVRDTKSRYDRIVPLTRRMLETLRVYWIARRPQHTLLFPAPDGMSPLKRDTVGWAVRTAARRAGIGKKVYPHLLRHTFATHLMELGADIRTVQILLGHRSLSSTARYTHLSEARRSTLSSPIEALNTEQGRVLG